MQERWGQVKQTFCADKSYVMRGQVAFFSNQAARGIPYVQDALACLPPSYTLVRGVCMYTLGLSGQATGQGDAVDQFLWANLRSRVRQK